MDHTKRYCPVMSRPVEGAPNFVYCQGEACMWFEYFGYKLNPLSHVALDFTSPEHDEMTAKIANQSGYDRERWRFLKRDSEGRSVYGKEVAAAGGCTMSNLSLIGNS